MKTHPQLLLTGRFAWSLRSRNSQLARWHGFAVLAGAMLTLLLGFADARAQENQKTALIERSPQQANGSSQDASQAREPVGSMATASVISSVIIGQESGRASVLVKGKGPLEAHVARTHNPDRLVLDFASTHLSVREPVIMDVGPPVRSARLGQFRPDVARVVIDLTPATSYTVSRSEGDLFIFIYVDKQSKSSLTENSRSAAIATPRDVLRQRDFYHLPVPLRKASGDSTDLQPAAPAFDSSEGPFVPAFVLASYTPTDRGPVPPFTAAAKPALQNQNAVLGGQTPQPSTSSPRDSSKSNKFSQQAPPAQQASAPTAQPGAQTGTAPTIRPENASQSAPQTPVSSENKQEMSVALNLENADLYQVLRIIGSELKINYVVDPSVKGTVTINTSGSISRADLFSLLESILQINGAAMVRQDGYYRVVSGGDAKAQPVPLEFVKAPEAPAAPGETLVLDVFPMHFVSAVEMSKVLAPFISPAGQVVVNEKGNILLILETPPKLKQVNDMLHIFDNPTFSRQRVRLYPVMNNSAKGIISELQDVFSGYSFTGNSAIRFVSVESLNAVLAICPNPEAFTEVETWIHQLDQPPQQVGEQNFVYAVQNAKASDLRDILIELYGGSVARPQQVAVSAIPPNPMGPPSVPEEVQKVQAPAAPERVQGRIHILSDDKNNALIIQANPHDYEILKHTIVQLDILPRQVLIDAKVYEVNLTGNLSLGVSYFLDQQNKLPAPLVTTGSFSAGQSGSSLQATTFSIIGKTRALQMFLNATDQRSRVRMLSSPSILVTDNTSARIQVGASVPVPIGSAVTPVQSGGSSVFAQTIQYQDTGVILTVTPHINASGVVAMSLTQEISSAVPNTTSQIQAPVINKSSFQTSVVLADGEPLALGGIITTTYSVSKDRIPGLGEIPLLGALFGNTSKQTARTELVLLLTPHVQQNLPQAATQSQDFIEKMREVRRDMEKMN